MRPNAQKQMGFGVSLVILTTLILSLYCGVAHALNGSMPPRSISGGSVYYKVGGYTHDALLKISFSSGFDLRLRLYDEDGGLMATGSSPNSTTRQIYEYLWGGETYYVAITYLSGAGAVSFTLTYQDVNTISYYGTTAPFSTADDQFLALAIGAPIILGAGFAIIGIFGRMKIRQRKSEIPLGVPSQLINLSPATPSPQPPVQKPAKVASQAPPAATPAAVAPPIKYCPYCGSDVVPGSATCKSCGNSLK